MNEKSKSKIKSKNEFYKTRIKNSINEIDLNLKIQIEIFQILKILSLSLTSWSQSQEHPTMKISRKK